MKPNLPWIIRHRILRAEYRYYWLLGTVERDGFKWTTRGLKDGHYAYKEYEPSSEIIYFQVVSCSLTSDPCWNSIYQKLLTPLPK